MLFLISLLCLALQLQPVWPLPVMQPVADPRAVVVAGHARFTVLTSHIVRLEWSSTQRWQDQATWAINFRRQPVPAFKQSANATHTIIATSALTLTYLTASTVSFNPSNIIVTAIGGAQWSARNHEELLNGRLPGTVRTLDGTNGEADIQLDCQYNTRSDLHCTYGVISRGGIAVIDDTHSPAYGNATWPWVEQPSAFPAAQQCAVDDAVKRDCASYPSIDERTCRALGCCWKPSARRAHSAALATPQQVGVPSCFYAADADQDLYLLGHGHDYKLAMREFTAIAGPIPLPPRYALGLFFSRWWAYASYEEKGLVDLYASHDVPLDNIVTDMDWHLTWYKAAAEGVVDQAGQSKGWTGFTFNPALFDDPAAYLAWCKLFNLHNSMNLHPASGLQLWEESYTAVADALDHRNRSAYIPLNLTDARFVHAWANLTLRPLEEAGIDLWWLDWQQGEDFVPLPRFNPTYWLNYLFFTDPYHWGNGKRPALLHRWGGLGNHRYQIGFSGDVETSWQSLTFQPYFTASSSNVGFSYFSHDLGSFGGRPDPELFTRWLQWGALSPVWRCHAGKDVTNVRFPWEFPFPYYHGLRAMFKLRQSLLPYIYTQARRTYDTGLGIVLPLYYEWPEDDEAYTNTHTYLFGERMFVAPITAPVDPATGLANWTYWLPHGTWVNLFSGRPVRGGVVTTVNYTLNEMAAFVSAGSIIPLLPDSAPPIGQAKLVPEALKLVAFVGMSAQGSGRMYDDEGDSEAYQSGAFSYTNFSYAIAGSSGTALSFVIGAAQGTFEGLPASRTWEIHLRGVMPATEVRVNGGTPLPFQPFLGLSPAIARAQMPNSAAYSYDASTLAVIVYLNTPASVRETNTLQVQLSQPLAAVDASTLAFPGLLARLVAAKIALDNEWGTDHTVYMDDYSQLLLAAQMGDKLNNAVRRNVSAVPAALVTVPALVAAACVEINGGISNLRPALRTQLEAQLCHGSA